VPLVIVTVFPEIAQEPVAVIVAVVLAFVVATTAKDELNAAVGGAPVNVTVGVAGLIIRLPVAVDPRKILCDA
jgi:ABC-type amino acid transport system permease subunit